MPKFVTDFGTLLVSTIRVIRTQGPSQIQFWLIALIVGILAGTAAVIFRTAINFFQATVYQTPEILQVDLPWYLLILIPALGGLAVGVIMDRYSADGRVRAVADVIEGSALKEGRVETREGIASVFSSLITLSTGGSTGREGPVVHLAGVISTRFANLIRADGVTGRELLGCAVAAAVSASFNAPIAGAIFALEVILRHMAVHAFAPIVIASVAGTVVGHLTFGNVTEFTLTPATELAFYM